MKFKSTLLAEASGALAGLVFSHNRGGAYIRQRVIPVNPSSSFQQAVRNFMLVCAGAWNNVLTVQQRAGWTWYATPSRCRTRWATPVPDRDRHVLSEQRRQTPSRPRSRRRTPEVMAAPDLHATDDHVDRRKRQQAHPCLPSNRRLVRRSRRRLSWSSSPVVLAPLPSLLQGPVPLRGQSRRSPEPAREPGGATASAPGLRRPAGRRSSACVPGGRPAVRSLSP